MPGAAVATAGRVPPPSRQRSAPAAAACRVRRATGTSSNLHVAKKQPDKLLAGNGCPVNEYIECRNMPMQTLFAGTTTTRWAAVCCLAIGQGEPVQTSAKISHRAAQAGFRDAPEYCKHAESHVQSDSSREVGRGPPAAAAAAALQLMQCDNFWKWLCKHDVPCE